MTLPDIAFEGELLIDPGGLSTRVFLAESPHSDDTVLIHVLEEGLLFLGDSTSEDFYNDGYLDKTKLAALIRTIESTECSHCILSHAEPLTKSELLAYLMAL